MPRRNMRLIISIRANRWRCCRSDTHKEDRVMKSVIVLTACTCLLGIAVGCVQAPKSIAVNVGNDRPEPVDSSRVPNPQTMDEARQELHKAYRYVQWLEEENADLKHDKAKYKRKLEACEDRLERYEDD